MQKKAILGKFFNTSLVLIFLFGVCASIFYYRTIRNAVIHIGNKIYSKVTKFYLYIENLMLKAH